MSSVSRVYSLGNDCIKNWDPLGWARITTGFILNDPWKQPGQTCSAMPALRAGCLKKHNLEKKLGVPMDIPAQHLAPSPFIFKAELGKRGFGSGFKIKKIP